MRARLGALATFTRERPLRVVLGASLLIGSAIAVARPFENEFPAYLENADALLAHGRHPPNAFWPTGYETFLLGGLALGDRTGVVILQVLAYGALVVLAYAALRLLRIDAGPAAIGALVVGVHPQFLVGITRVADLSLTAPLLLAVVAAALWIEREGLSVRRALLLGFAAGALAAVRPNLIPVLLIALWIIRRRLHARGALAGAAATFVPVIACSTIMLGHPVLISSNGPYNLAAGANELSEYILVRAYNAEPSLTAYGQYFRVTTLEALQEESKHDELNRLARDFVRDHPAEFVKLAGLKLLTAFRPDLRPRDEGERTPFESLVNIVSALPILLWLLAAVAARRLGIRTEPLTTTLVIAIIALYVLPLMLTNSDPRFRYALDGVLLLHAAAIAGTWWQRRARACAA